MKLLRMNSVTVIFLLMVLVLTSPVPSIEMLKKDKEDSDYSFLNLDEDRIRDVMDLITWELFFLFVFIKDMVEKKCSII